MEYQVPETLSISEIAERAGVTPRTVRYYVAEGLLPPPSGAGQQRVYNAEHLLRLRAIKALKAAYLPLSEIRKRLATLSPADLARLAAEPPAPPSSALEYLTSISPWAAPHAHSSSKPSASGPPGSPLMARQVEEQAFRSDLSSLQFDVRGAHRLYRSPPPTPRGSIWQRITLAPGVELHYQPSGDRRRDEAIAHLIRVASHFLADLPFEESR